jgi:hypothetical protein
MGRIITGGETVAHSFEAKLDWSCVREIITLVRKGEMSVDDRIDMGQHAAWFGGSALEWYRVRRKDVPDGVDLSLLERILSLFGGGKLFGDDGYETSLSDDELCDKCENVLATIEADTDGDYAAFPIIQVLSIIIPIIIELIKRRNS